MISKYDKTKKLISRIFFFAFILHRNRKKAPCRLKYKWGESSALALPCVGAGKPVCCNGNVACDELKFKKFLSALWTYSKTLSHIELLTDLKMSGETPAVKKEK